MSNDDLLARSTRCRLDACSGKFERLSLNFSPRVLAIIYKAIWNSLPHQLNWAAPASSLDHLKRARAILPMTSAAYVICRSLIQRGHVYVATCSKMSAATSMENDSQVKTNKSLNKKTQTENSGEIWGFVTVENGLFKQCCREVDCQLWIS